MTSPACATLMAVDSGRTIVVPEEGVTFGGETAEVPIAGITEPIAFLDPVDEGFVVTDQGIAPCTVNAMPVIGQRLARVGDTLRVGGEVFVLEPAPVVETPASIIDAPAAVPVDVPVEVPVAVVEPPPAPSAPPAMARLEVIGGGILSGRTFDLPTRLTLVGRGAHNDVALDDDTVSDAHAKIIRRANGWFVVDEGSTNGTYVAGRRIDGQRRLAPGSEVRFGGVKLRFEPLDGDSPDVTAKGTRQVVATPRPEGGRAAPEAVIPAPPLAAPVVTPGAPPRATVWRAVLGWVVVTVVVMGSAIAGYLIAAMLRGGR